MSGLRCPHRDSDMSRAVDSRDHDHGKLRRRECLGCDRRFGTFEIANPARGGVVLAKEKGKYTVQPTREWVERVAERIEKTIRAEINNLPFRRAVRRATDEPI